MTNRVAKILVPSFVLSTESGIFLVHWNLSPCQNKGWRADLILKIVDVIGVNCFTSDWGFCCLQETWKECQHYTLASYLVIMSMHHSLNIAVYSGKNSMWPQINKCICSKYFM